MRETAMRAVPDLLLACSDAFRAETMDQRLLVADSAERPCGGPSCLLECGTMSPGTSCRSQAALHPVLAGQLDGCLYCSNAGLPAGLPFKDIVCYANVSYCSKALCRFFEMFSLVVSSHCSQQRLAIEPSCIVVSGSELP